MSEIAYTLEQAEKDLRHAYWHIRNGRKTNWREVNKARWVKQAMRQMGITDAEIKAAMYCLKNINCKICNKASDHNIISCSEIGKKREYLKINKEK